jgi:hypothetical protein
LKSLVLRICSHHKTADEEDEDSGKGRRRQRIKEEGEDKSHRKQKFENSSHSGKVFVGKKILIELNKN